MKIETRSRIHLTLLGLNHHCFRKNGGAGFFVDHPNLRITISKSAKTNLDILHSCGFTPDEIANLLSKLSHTKRLYKLSHTIHIDNVSCIGHHIGLGTGTSLAMACMESLFLINGVPISENDLIRESGRGGTSGIGINGYLRGGFIVDSGIQVDNNNFASSDDIHSPTHVPKILTRFDMPRWPIGILIPEGKTGVSLKTERELFSSQTPIPMYDIYKQTYNVIFGALAAVACNDAQTFRKAIREIQGGKWKSSEIAIHSPKSTQEIGQLYAAGCDAVGLSSAGPCLYFLADNFKRASQNARDIFGNHRVIETFPCNSGRTIYA